MACGGAESWAATRHGAASGVLCDSIEPSPPGLAARVSPPQLLSGWQLLSSSARPRVMWVAAHCMALPGHWDDRWELLLNCLDHIMVRICACVCVCVYMCVYVCPFVRVCTCFVRWEIGRMCELGNGRDEAGPSGSSWGQGEGPAVRAAPPLCACRPR